MLSFIKNGRNKKRLEEEEHKRKYAAISDMLKSLIDTIEMVGGEYKYNEPGTSDVTYVLSGKVLDFSESAFKFRGFYIDTIQVSFRDVMNLILNKANEEPIEGTAQIQSEL